MKHLILLRHAKTENRNPGGDHARQLVPRAREDCALIVRYMQDHNIAPDHALLSDATRTRQTLEEMRPVLAAGCGISLRESLYLAEPEEILKEIKEAPASSNTLLTVGHNPGIHMLAFSLMNRKQRQLRSDLAGNFPTSAMAVLSFAVEDWAGIAPGAGTLEHFVTARSLRSGNAPGSTDQPEWR